MQRSRRAGPSWVTPALLAVALSGCDSAELGPKRDDHEAAHRRSYHPDVTRELRGEPVTTGPAEDVPEDDGSQGPLVGKQALFVNNETLIVQDILEPLVEDLREKSRSLPPRDYADYVRRQVYLEIQRQISHLVVAAKARPVFEEKRFQDALDKEAADIVRKLIQRRYGGVQARYKQHLASFGMTLDDARARAKREAMVIGYLQREYLPIRTEPTRRELVNYYRRHIDRYTTPPKAELFLIDVPFQPDTAASRGEGGETASGTHSREDALTTIRLARQELQDGVPFEDVARKYSQGLRASNGGAWGEISPGALTRRWARANEVLFTLESGEVSDIIETDEGCFIVKCGRKSPQSQLSFEDAQKDIGRRLQADQFEQWSSKYVARLIEETGIDLQDKLAFARAVMMACPLPDPQHGATDAPPFANR